MTINELIKQLQATGNGDASVIVKKDAEGNDYSPLADIGLCWYTPESTRSGRCHNGADLAAGDDHLEDSSEIVLVLEPVN